MTTATTTTTTTAIRRGSLVTLPDGTRTRVLSTRGGYIHTSAGTFAPWQLAPAPPDPVASARAFLDTQSAAMRSWDNAALPSRKEFEAALAHIQGLLGVLSESEVSE
jgi:hypothetical protein